MLCSPELFLKLVKKDPFQQAIKISFICYVSQTINLKPDSIRIIPRGGYRMGYRQPVEALQWLAYISQTHNIITHAGNGGSSFGQNKYCRLRNTF